jgi:hypothetical protein
MLDFSCIDSSCPSLGSGLVGLALSCGFTTCAEAECVDRTPSPPVLDAFFFGAAGGLSNPFRQLERINKCLFNGKECGITRGVGISSYLCKRDCICGIC